jgi:hypothetical protein
MARMMTPEEFALGGMRDGVQLDPVAYLLGALRNRFSALEEEARLSSMTEMLAFQRRPGEHIDSLLARYETVRQRAAVEGQFAMSIEGCSLQLLRAIGIQSQHLYTLLQPFGGRLPSTDVQFQATTAQLSRHGHISEGFRGNVASALSGPMRQARQGSYWSDQQHQPAAPTYPAQHYYGPSSSSSSWDHMLPQHAVAQPDPFALWSPGGSQAADTWAQQRTFLQQSDWTGEQVYFDAPAEETDSATSSDSGNKEVTDIDFAHLSDRDASEQLCWAYRQARRAWRQFTGKPVRRFRCVIERAEGYREGEGEGFFRTQDDTC